MNTILEPSFLFISEEQWRDVEKRDAFLEHFLGHLEKISNYSITKIYWTDALEELLMNHAYSPPWVSDVKWRNQFFPILYNQFNPIKLIVSSELSWDACQCSPVLSSFQRNTEILERFLELVHILINKNEKVYFCLGFDKQRTNCLSYCFSCKCHENHLEPIVIVAPDSWFDHIDIVSVCWPQNSQDAFKLQLALKIILKKKLFKQISDLRYNYETSESFIKDIAKESIYRENILYSLAKRLTLTQGEAVSDEGLSDEPVRGKKGERRFRVSGVCRIHYKYSETGDLLLLNYYGEGKHDKGLK
ncbi:hypothetical protein [Microcoleus sp. FACHB-68]|uniref:hypothetical protein n=1 Tax=Microcoleus sp. FACHB-68 TaxID=2692826 RepID=UPI0016821822|nr:hypothetical protein [Microcoleus sp. FACHB-68]